MFEKYFEALGILMKIKGVIDNKMTVIDIEYYLERPKDSEIIEGKRPIVTYKSFKVSDESKFNPEIKSHITQVINDNHIPSIISFLENYYSTSPLIFVAGISSGSSDVNS